MICKYQKSAASSLALIDTRFELRAESTSDHHVIVPDGTPGLLYVSQGGFHRKDTQGIDYFSSGQLYLFGQKTSSVEYSSDDPNFVAYGIKMLPPAIYSLFGMAAEEITNQVVKVDRSLMNKDQIIEFLQSANPETIRPFDLVFLQEEIRIPALLKAILGDIHQSFGMISIQYLLTKYNVGYKRLQRLFKLHVGLTPKLYARIIRFNYCVRVGTHQPEKLTDVAYQGGFFDQNHFIKEIKHFTGQVPSQLFHNNGMSLEQEHLRYLHSRGY